MLEFIIQKLRTDAPQVPCEANGASPVPMSGPPAFQQMLQPRVSPSANLHTAQQNVLSCQFVNKICDIFFFYSIVYFPESGVSFCLVLKSCRCTIGTCANGCVNFEKPAPRSQHFVSVFHLLLSWTTWTYSKSLRMTNAMMTRTISVSSRGVRHWNTRHFQDKIFNCPRWKRINAFKRVAYYYYC
jgi:hypothetical protein